MKDMNREYDVLIVGAGVAGVHAAFAAAQKKASVLLVTSSWETATALGWGPLFGDTAQLRARALGVGATDSPAAAVRRALIFDGGPAANGAALVDSYDFQGFWRYELEKRAAISIFQDTCERLSMADNSWAAETGWGVTLKAKTVVLAVGTFLGGRVACGNAIMPGGRPGEAGAENLESCLLGLGVALQERTWRAGPTFDARSIEWARQGTGDPAREKGRSQPVCWADGRPATSACLEPTNKSHDQYYLRISDDEMLGREEPPAGLYGEIAGLKKARVTKPGFSVSSLSVPRELVSATTLNYGGLERLFLAGRIIGTDSYGQSAHDGLTAGLAAAAVSRGT